MFLLRTMTSGKRCLEKNWIKSRNLVRWRYTYTTHIIDNIFSANINLIKIKYTHCPIHWNSGSSRRVLSHQQYNILSSKLLHLYTISQTHEVVTESIKLYQQSFCEKRMPFTSWLTTKRMVHRKFWPITSYDCVWKLHMKGRKTVESPNWRWLNERNP